MDLTNEYKLMCLNANEIQEKWNPQIGDFMATKASYCGEDNCSDETPCHNCLEMSNIYVVSGKYNYAESVGGTHWFFGGEACVKGDGYICNDTHCYIMTESGHSTILPKLYTSAKSEMLWLPRQDQIQSMFLSGLTEQFKMRRFLDWLDTEAKYNPHTYSLEMLWMMFYMFVVHGKEWNSMGNVKKWECI